jgi:hypothetical protein
MFQGIYGELVETSMGELMGGVSVRIADLMREERFREAAPLLIQACSAAAADRSDWTGLGRCLIELGQDAGFFSLIEKRQAAAGDAACLFYDCLSELQVTGRREPLLRIIAATPRNTVLFPVALYFSGIGACETDPNRAIEEIKAASAAAQNCAALYESDPFLTTLLYEGEVLEPFGVIAEIERNKRAVIFAEHGDLEPAAQFAAAESRAPVEAPFVYYSSCNEDYLDRFGEALVRALDTIGLRTVYHFHVIDPSPEIGAKIALLQASSRLLDLRLSTETYRHARTGYGRATFYACGRLLRLPEIIAHYQRDVMMWDMDIAAVHGIDRLIAAMQGYDLGYFEMKGLRLPLICHLATAYFANTPVSRRCADLVACYTALKLQHAPYWSLDQASLFCVSRYLKMTGGMRINDFSMMPGGKFEDYVEVAATAAEKQGMRKLARPR